jgi:hypothetical protein
MSNRANSSDLSQDDRRVRRRGNQAQMFVAIYLISVIVTLLSAFAFRQLLRWALT